MGRVPDAAPAVVGVEGNVPEHPSPVGGRLAQFASRWETITQDRFVLMTVKEGYRIEFTGNYTLSRSPIFFPPPRLDEQRVALRDEVENLLAKKAVVKVSESECQTPGFYSHVFMRPKPSGAWRPILNLKKLNKSIRAKRFRMDTLQVVMENLVVGEYVTSIDLKDAYFHVPIHLRDRKFLRFAVEGEVFEFQVLPFGLSTAPRVFTRVVRALVAYLRKRGIKMFAYLDDWLLVNKSPQRLLEQTRLVLKICEELGLLVNDDKSDLEPTQSPVYLGAFLDLRRGLVRPSDARIEQLELFVQNLLTEGVAPALFWLQMLGRMASCKGIVPFSMLRMRLIQMCFQSQWNRTLPLSVEVTFPATLVPHLRWWLDRTNTCVGHPFHLPPADLVLTTDASEFGWGGHIDDRKVAGRWTDKEKGEHINVLELKAVMFSLERFVNLVRLKSVLIQTDNTTVAAYINKQGGTRSPSLCLLTLDLFGWCFRYGVQLKARYLPGTQNHLADDLSRGRVSPTEWALNRGVVDSLFKVFWRPHVDLFATADNCVVPTFCARNPHPLAWAVDALGLDWSGMQAYAYPPISLIPKVLEKVEGGPCRILLIAPLWPRQHWFPRLVSLVAAPPRVLPERADLLTQGKWRFPQPENLHLTAWLLTSVPSERLVFLNGLHRWQQHLEDPVQFGCTIPEFVIGTNGAGQEVKVPILHL